MAQNNFGCQQQQLKAAVRSVHCSQVLGLLPDVNTLDTVYFTAVDTVHWKQAV